MTVLGKEIDFDVTAPDDLGRYLDAWQAMNEKAKALPPCPAPDQLSTPQGLAAYRDYLTENCRLLTDFIDAAFGEGTCNALLGKKTSLETLLCVTDALRDAVGMQGRDFAAHLAAYAPTVVDT